MSSLKKFVSLVPKWKGGVSKLTSNLNFLVKSAWFLMILGYLSSFHRSIFYNLAIIPGEFFPPNFKIWTIVTHIFVEVHIWNLCCNLVIIFLYHQLLGPLWGQAEMHKFIVINTVISALCNAVLYIVYYLFIDKLDLIFNVSIYGFSASIAGFSVAVKQIMPDQVLFTFRSFKLQNKHIPSILLLTVSLAYVLRIVQLTYPILFFFGFLSSWVYLRFHQAHNNHNYGDAADTFAFASFFPELLQPFIRVPSNQLHTLLTCAGICPRPSKSSLVSLSNIDPSHSLPSHVSVSKATIGNQATTTDSTSLPSYSQHQQQQNSTFPRPEHDLLHQPSINIKEALSKNLITFKVVQNTP